MKHIAAALILFLGATTLTAADAQLAERVRAEFLWGFLTVDAARNDI
jgi:hypothetical protein